MYMYISSSFLANRPEESLLSKRGRHDGLKRQPRVESCVKAAHECDVITNEHLTSSTRISRCALAAIHSTQHGPVVGNKPPLPVNLDLDTTSSSPEASHKLVGSRQLLLTGEEVELRRLPTPKTSCKLCFKFFFCLVLISILSPVTVYCFYRTCNIQTYRFNLLDRF